jgi:hypothetical protein
LKKFRENDRFGGGGGGGEGAHEFSKFLEKLK